MARAGLSAALLATALLLQVGLLAWLPLPGATPDLVTMTLVTLALTWGPRHGAVAGFLVGLAVDLAPPVDHPAGQWALVLAVIGYAAGLFAREAEGSVLVPLIGVPVAVVAATVGFGALSMLMDVGGVTWGLVGRLLPSVAAYAVILTPFVVPAVTALTRRVTPRPVSW
jgi:rod shape-determining protein MreD